MTYVFDNSPLSALFKSYYRRRFPTLWHQFDGLVDSGNIISTREVLREIEDSLIESLRHWAVRNRKLFATPTAEEGAFVARIYAVRHFQQNIERQKLLKGGKNAVVTMEELKPNAAKIPNICNYFGVRWMTLEEFMEAEGWEF